MITLDELEKIETKSQLLAIIKKKKGAFINFAIELKEYNATVRIWQNLN